MFDIRSPEFTISKRPVSIVQVKKWVGVVSVVSKSEHPTIVAEAVDSARSVVDSSADFSDLSSDVPIVINEIVEEDSTWDLKDLRSKIDEAEANLKSSEEYVHFREDEVSEHNNRLVEKHASSSGY